MKAKPKPKRHNRKPAHGPNVWHKAFLTHLALTGNTSLSAAAAKVDRTTVYKARAEDKDFAAQWADCLDQAADRLEAEALRRAVDGVDEPVFGSGGTGVGTIEVGTIRRYSDTLLIFLLKGVRPDKFRERHHVKHDGLTSPVVVYLPDNNRDPATAGTARDVP
jgi:hypothetical protein